MFRLGRLKAPRKVQAASCLHLQLSKENFGDPARIAVLSDGWATRQGSQRKSRQGSHVGRRTLTRHSRRVSTPAIH